MNKLTKFILGLQIVISIYFFWKAGQHSEKAMEHTFMAQETQIKAEKSAKTAKLMKERAEALKEEVICGESAATAAVRALQACQNEK